MATGKTNPITEESRTWEVTPDLVGVFGMDGRFEAANPAWEKTLGRAPEELVGVPVFDLIHPDDLDATQAVLGGLGADEPALRFENRYRHADGSYRWLSWVAVPEDGKIYASARDVTEEKASQAALAERDRLWNASRDLWVVIGQDGLYREVNPAWSRALGHDRRDLIGARFDATAHPDDVEPVRRAFGAILEGEDLIGFELRMKTADGGYRWYEWRAYLEEGFVFGLGRDIEERKAREMELAQSKHERDLLWRASRDLYVTIGMDGLYREANPAWESELGYDPAALIGTSFDHIVHPDDQDRTRTKFAEVLSGDPAINYEIRTRAADGAYHWYAWNVIAEDGVVIAFGRSVDERRAREAELAAAEQALRQSQKLEMIGQLTGGVAHDFNNLLMAIQSSVQLASGRVADGDGKTRDLLANALRGVERGASLTQRMLAFARKQELDPVPTDTAALIGGMTDLLGRSLGPGVRIETDFAANLPPALADPNQLEMALLNLAVNARDAMDGMGRLTLRVAEAVVTGTAAVPPGRYVEITVRDEGGGMDAETLARATEPFFTTKEVGKGTGLGLPMIHGLAEQSGGAFALESEVGVGTSARLLLPVAEAASEPAAQPRAAQTEQAEPRERRPLNVLAVDDDMLVLMGTVGMLEDLGHEVSSACSGEEALDLLAKDPGLDLVLTDQAMPKMTGTQLAERIRGDRPDVPVVLATGYADRLGGEGDLFAAQIGKPFTLAALQDAIARVTG